MPGRAAAALVVVLLAACEVPLGGGKPVASVVVTPPSASILIGATLQLTATPEDSSGNALTGRVLTWATSDAAVATVSGTGLVMAKVAGAATITASTEGKTGTAAITVVTVPVASVIVSPATANLFVGSTLQLAATTKDSVGNVLTGRVVTWTSLSPSLATVGGTGLVTGVAAGSATITATAEGKTATAVITVATVPVASVTVSPTTASVAVGATVQLAATTKDSAGNVLTGRVITWTSSNPALATVSGTGLVTGVGAGSDIITATSEGKAGTAAVTVTAVTGMHAGWYASPSGTSGGDGSAARPWDLQTALGGGNGSIHAGDTLWLRGGTYAGTFVSSLTGTATASIVVRQYPGERATVDGGATQTDVLTVNGGYAIYWGFEIMESGTQRFGLAGTGTGLRGDGVYVNNASNVKLINLIVHDTGHGTYTENSAHNIEIYGWIIYNGGNEDSSRSDGHGIYIKNDGIGWKIARDNVIFDQFGFGIHGYAQAGTNLINMILDGNVLFDNGTPSNFDNPNMQLGGTVVADNDTVTNNMVYFAPGVSSGNGNVRIGYSSTANGTAVFANNYIVGGTETLDVGYWASLTAQGNTLVAPTLVLVQNDGASASTEHWTGNMHYHDPTALAWQLAGRSYTFSNWEVQAGASDQVSATPPATPRVFVRPNRYEGGRATIVIYNWSLQASVPVDLTGVVTVGKHYDVRNVQDIFGTPVVSGTYAGGTITIPMTGVTPPQPIGGSFRPLVKTAPAFDAFIVTSGP
ncbi:MAG TPA: Ig-like domain-containing protein [Gemmatimonadales bacterium]|nr:Ig-like domain-containing protein [Gemmatimonadales bacterium]